MSFQWTQHRFSGGALALDVANSVILRFDAARRMDRFAVPAQLDAFADAASAFCRERDAFGPLAPAELAGQRRLLVLREAVDGYFRQRIVSGRDDNGALARLLGVVADILSAYPDTPSPCPVDLAAARSALGLLATAPGRMKICPNCAWLFVDFSRNGSRTWCDMAVCGNRAKARLHYRKTRDGEA